MKKLIAAILVMAMAFSLFACGSSENESQSQEEQATYSEAIPIGDGVPDFDITGKCFGTYVETEMFEDTELAEGETVVTYQCPESDTPVIEVYSIAKGDRTLEEYTSDEAKIWGNGYYIMVEDFGFYTNPWEEEDGFIYVSNVTYEGEEQFHTITFCNKTEELYLGEDLYMYVPTGYEETAFGECIFGAVYDESYALPNIRVSIDTGDYEGTQANFAYNGDNDFTEEQYNKWAENWSEEDENEFFAAVGYKIVTTLEMDNIYAYVLDNQRQEESFCGIAYVEGEQNTYRLNMWCDEGMPEYPFLYTMMKSVHKGPCKVSIGEGHEAYELSSDYSVGEIGENFAALGCTEYYKDARGLCDIRIFREKNTEGISLEELAQSFADQTNGCVEKNDFYDGILAEGEEATEFSYIIPHFEEEGGNYFIVNTDIMEVGNEFVYVDYWYYTREVQFADSDLYFWWPLVYEESEVSEAEISEGCLMNYTVSDDYWIPEASVYSWANDDWAYPGDFFMNNYGKEIDITEEEFNELLKDGFTLEEYRTVYDSIFGIEDEGIIKPEEDITIIAIQYNSDFIEGDPVTVVDVTLLEDGKFYSIIMTTPVGGWHGHGKAISFGIHRGSQAK